MFIAEINVSRTTNKGRVVRMQCAAEGIVTSDKLSRVLEEAAKVIGPPKCRGEFNAVMEHNEINGQSDYVNKLLFLVATGLKSNSISRLGLSVSC